MKINQINNGLSMKALYFPAKPKLNVTPEIKNAICNNAYIKSLSEKEDVFARFIPKNQCGMSSHLLILDIVDFEKLTTKKSMWFSSRMFGTYADIKPLDFIAKITNPQKTNPVKNSFWKRLFSEDPTKYFNYHDDLFLLKKGLLKENEALKQAENERLKINSEIMKQYV